MPRQQQQALADSSRSVQAEENVVNGVADGDEVMEEEVEQEGYGEYLCSSR